MVAPSSSIKVYLGGRVLQPASRRNTSVVEDIAQQRAVNLEAVGVVDEAHFLEFVHKQIHAGPCCTNHFRPLLSKLSENWSPTSPE
jgi:hypothetical protein